MSKKLLFIALAGCAGTLCRYWLAGLIHRLNVFSFPLGTLVVNITGCFLAGILWALFENRWQVSGETRTIILVGFMGAFTTFSAYILETGELVRSSEWLLAFGNIALQNGLGFMALFTGALLGRLA